MKNSNLTLMSNAELKRINGGIWPLIFKAVAGIVLAADAIIVAGVVYGANEGDEACAEVCPGN